MEWHPAFQDDFIATFLHFLRRVKRKGTTSSKKLDSNRVQARQDENQGQEVWRFTTLEFWRDWGRARMRDSRENESTESRPERHRLRAVEARVRVVKRGTTQNRWGFGEFEEFPDNSVLLCRRGAYSGQLYSFYGPQRPSGSL